MVRNTAVATRATVLARLAESMPPDQQEVALGLLDTYGLRPFERERERVQMDLLFISRGDIERLRHYVTRAKRDYRDIICWAEYSPQPTG